MRCSNLAAVCLLIGILSGCTTEKAAETLRSEWIGKNADNFFLRHGPPSGSFPLTDGRQIFTWQSNVLNYQLPGSARSTSTVSGRSVYTTTTVDPATDVKVYCRVQLVTNAQRTILEIRPDADTIGEWQISRCAEIFSPPTN